MGNKKNLWMCVYLEINLFAYDLPKKIYNISYMFWFLLNTITDIKKEETSPTKSAMHRYNWGRDNFFYNLF